MSLLSIIKNNDKLLVFGKKICPNCKKLKNLLEGIDVEFDTILIEDYMAKYDDDDIIFEEIELLKKKHDISSYPFIFIKSDFDGGFDRYKRMSDIGTLTAYLKSKNVAFRKRPEVSDCVEDF